MDAFELEFHLEGGHAHQYNSSLIYHELGIPLTINYSRNLLEGNLISVGDTGGFLTLYKIFHMENSLAEDAEKRHTRLFSRRLHNNSITEVKFQKLDFESDAIERYIYTSSTDSFIVKFDLEQENESCKIRAHKEWVKKFSLSSENASLLATVGNDGNFFIFDNRYFNKKASLCSSGKFNSGQSKDCSIDMLRKNNIIDTNTFKNIEKINLVPKIELFGIHEPNKKTNLIKKSQSRERLIGKKNLSISAVNFLSQLNYISTCGSSDGYIKIWDIRKLSNTNSEDNYIHKFSPQMEDDKTDNSELRGIIWMDVDDSYNKLGVRTRDGTIYVYNISDILSLEKGVKPLVIDMNKLFPEEKCELADSSQKPSISCFGNWIATPSNSGNIISVFDISDLSKKLEPYFIHKSGNADEFPEFQCIEWKKIYNISSLSHIFPLKGLKKQLGKVFDVGKEYCSNFLVGTKSGYLKVFDNKDFQVNFRKSAMPDFSDLSQKGPLPMDCGMKCNKNGEKLKSQWVSGESLSFSGSFEGDSEALNQLSLSSSLSVPIPKPTRGSITGAEVGVKKVANDDAEITNSTNNDSSNSLKENKTGFLTLGNLSLSEKEPISNSDGLKGSSGLIGEHVEKTPFRRSIPFSGSSQDSVGYPAPHRGQCGYISQSQESLMTPKSFDNTNSIKSEKNNVYDEYTDSSKDNTSRKIIHIPLSQSNEEVNGSPSLNSIEIFTEIRDYDKVTTNSNSRDITKCQDAFSDKCMYDRVNEYSSEEENKGFKQRRLDSWVRAKKNIEASTTNNSSAELSPTN
ncbi:hypothetical protein FG379_002504 [Cryptosporidium bovis]|uniref:uncharacterized protein n=1 Tax=Cryptosporidium bovis TaxID=310047 RepID=UPI00351A621E|nr:hypothetical protein FG379_002504 [Cryptosporidium bovis]